MTLQDATDRVLRYSDCIRHMEHALSGPMALEVRPHEIVDQAGEHLVNLHEWKWLELRTEQLELRARIDMTAATFTAATKTLTKTGAFTNYHPVAGDTLTPLSGTAVVLRQVKVLSRTDANSIVLDRDITSNASNPVDVSARMENDLVELPDNIRDARSMSPTDAVINGLTWTTHEDLMRRRTSQVDVTSNWNLYGCINYAGDPPRPVLEVWPNQTQTTDGGLTISYRVGWQSSTEDTDTVKIPSFMHTCMLRLCRIFVMGYEEGEEAEKKSIDVLLADFAQSPILHAAKRRDGIVQPTMGPLRGGAVQRMSYNTTRLLSNPVDAPS